jgi:hypothetical protein
MSVSEHDIQLLAMNSVTTSLLLASSLAAGSMNVQLTDFRLNTSDKLGAGVSQSV